MNFFENKRAVALTGVFALAFAGTLVFAFGKKSELEAAVAKSEAISKQLKSATNSENSPTEDTINRVRQGAETMKGLTASLKKELSAYTKTCEKVTQVADNFTPKHITTARKALQALCEANKVGDRACELEGNDKFCFGLKDTFEATDFECNNQYAPQQIFQLNAARTLASYAVEAGATRIDRMYCEPTRTKEVGAQYDVNLVNDSEKQWPYLPIHIEMSFTAPRPADDADAAPLTKVLNSITEGKGSIITTDAEKAINGQKYFFVVKAINVKANNRSEGLENFSAPTAVNGETGAQPAYSVADQKTGFASDTVRVNLVVEAVYFPFKSKEN